MARVGFIIKMEACMMEIGSITKCMAKECFIINQGPQPMKVIGAMINFKVEASFIIKFHKNYRIISITKILMKLINAGSIMMVIFIHNIGQFVNDMK